MRSAKSKGVKDKAYLEFVHAWKCVACTGGQLVPRRPQDGAVQAHHAGVRGLSQRADDKSALPLCFPHHNRESRVSVHTLGKSFWTTYNLDKADLIRRLNQMFDSIQNRRSA